MYCSLYLPWEPGRRHWWRWSSSSRLAEAREPRGRSCDGHCQTLPDGDEDDNDNNVGTANDVINDDGNGNDDKLDGVGPVDNWPSTD